jgi:starch synthase
VTKVVQTVYGKFHHFDLARQLHRQGMLEAIFTGYPRWKLRDENLPQDKMRTYPWIETFLMAAGRYRVLPRWLDRELNYLMAQTLDAHVAANIPECDVFVGISGSGLKTSGVVHQRGAQYICDRGSSHVGYTERILTEEFSRWGQKFPGIDPRSVAKEEREYAAADVITVPSEFCVRSFVEMGVSHEKLRKIPYGVELTRFGKVADPATGQFEVLFVGQVSFRKGVPYLIEAFGQLKHPRKRLRIVGAMLPEIETWLREKPAPQGVEFIGAVPQEKVPELMSASHVTVLPSIEDGFGLVLGQAMACGCPVISSTNTGGEEMIEDGQEGFIVPIRDPKAIAARLERLAQDDDLRQRMGEAAIRKVRGMGGWDDYGNAYGDLCRELAGTESRDMKPCANQTLRLQSATVESCGGPQHSKTSRSI